MLERGYRAGLAVEARLDRRVVREVLVQRLQRDLPRRRPELLLGHVDATHAALSEELDDLVLADRLPDERVVLRLGHALGHRVQGSHKTEIFSEQTIPLRGFNAHLPRSISSPCRPATRAAIRRQDTFFRRPRKR